MHHRLDGMSMQRRPRDERPVMPPIACAATRICSDPLPCYSRLINFRPCQFVQVRAMSRQVLVGPYGVLLAAFAQVTVGFVQLRRRDEAQSSWIGTPR